MPILAIFHLCPGKKHLGGALPGGAALPLVWVRLWRKVSRVLDQHSI